MLNKIIQYSLHNRLVVMIASIALLLWGSYTAHKMEVDVFPDLNAPTVVVMTGFIQYIYCFSCASLT